MGARVTDPVDPLDSVEHAEQAREARTLLTPARKVAAVGVDVLPKQRDLAHPVRRHSLDLGQQLQRRAADLPSSGGRDDAVGAGAVAAHADLHPALEGAGASGREMAGEALELEVALSGQRVAGQELRKLVHLAWPEGDIDEREALEHLVLDRLSPAASHPHHPLGLFSLEALGLPQVGDEAAVRGLADRAGVEEDQIRLGALGRLGVAERLEHPLHPLRVVLVHLAPERGQVVALHGRSVPAWSRGPRVRLQLSQSRPTRRPLLVRWQSEPARPCRGRSA